MALQFTTSYLEDTVSLFRYYKSLAERAMAQVTDQQLFAVLDPEMNSIAIIIKHLTGNMRSRWTGFPDADGEKPDRDRDGEFTNPPATREELMSTWEQASPIVHRSRMPTSLAKPTFAASGIPSCKPSPGTLRITPTIAGRSCCLRNTSR